MLRNVLKGQPASLGRDGEIDQAEGITPACQTCKWRNKETLTTCAAFPDGIPVKILMGGHDHTSYYNEDGHDDHGIVYAPVEGLKKKGFLSVLSV